MSLVRRVLGQRGAERKPWLARREWRERRIVSYGGPRGFYFALALVGFGLPAVFLAAVGAARMVDGDPEGMGALLGGGVCGIIFAFITYLWVRRIRFGDSVCHLGTLPGVIGGWFKASVEARLPGELAPPVQVTLRNVQMLGRVVVRRWEKTYRVSPARLTRLQGHRYLVPARFQIPPGGGNYATWSRWSGGGWFLVVAAELPGMDFFAGFPVPIFETAEALQRNRDRKRGLDRDQYGIGRKDSVVATGRWRGRERGQAPVFRCSSQEREEWGQAPVFRYRLGNRNSGA